MQRYRKVLQYLAFQFFSFLQVGAQTSHLCVFVTGCYAWENEQVSAQLT